MVDEVLDLIGLKLGLGEDVGVADGDGAGGDSGQALARTVTRAGDGDIGVGVHELLGSGLDESLERRGTVVGHLAGDGLGSSGATLGRRHRMRRSRRTQRDRDRRCWQDHQRGRGTDDENKPDRA